MYMIHKHRLNSYKLKVSIFLIIEILMYSIFLTHDVLVKTNHNFSNCIKYMSIIVCFLFVISERNKNRLDKNLLMTGMFFTLCADWFLLLHEDYTIGVSFFIVVQFLYMLRIENLSDRQDNSMKCNRILYKIGFNILFVTLALIIASFLKLNLDILLVIILYYFASIVNNTICALYLSIHNQSQWQYTIFAIGMVLFLLCDINVGIYNIKDFLMVDHMLIDRISHISAIAMWLFYLPSQVCISLSISQNQR